ncbi:MAG: hypothetical protein JSU74_07465 [Candidatus Zixiibacteriota bacterium]|nr:MAG: hypothetical protein JSU74_07465 [candidate division Zixibacteria bacterium]
MRWKLFCNHVPWLCCLLIFLSGDTCASTSDNLSVFESEQLKIRYNLTDEAAYEGAGLALGSDLAGDGVARFDDGRKRKSPGKAFLLSLAVPGLGQYYYGSKVKPFIFLGAEVASWVMYFNWHGEGDDITTEFEAFNREHWSRDRYEQQYLLWTYGVTDDDSLPPATPGITHNLPDTRTQQYYEMTGKYDQFAWGWDDAVLGGNVLDDYSATDPPPIIVGDAGTPSSANRLHYETRRNDANNAYDKATRMIFVSMANRLISAFEALFTTKSINRNLQRSGGSFGKVKVSAKLKSFYTKRDTPYLTVTYKF